MGMPINYRFDDPNAPQTNGTKEAFYNMLKAVLVDGYGDKPGAGWTVAMEPDPEYLKFAFRNNPITGSGRVIIFECPSNYASYTYRNTYYITGAEDVNGSEFVLPFESTWYQAFSYLSYSNATYASTWNIVADDRFMFLQAYNWTPASFNEDDQSNKYMACFGFGDLIPLSVNDTWATVFLCGVRGNQQGALPQSSTNFSANALYSGVLCRSTGGGEGSCFAGLSSNIGMSGSYGDPNWVTGDPITLFRPLAYGREGNPLQPKLRGIVPGLFHFFAGNSAANLGHMKVYTIGGKDYVIFRCFSGGFLVCISDEWNYQEITG